MNEKRVVLRLQNDENHRGNLHRDEATIKHTGLYFVLIGFKEEHIEGDKAQSDDGIGNSSGAKTKHG